MPRRRLGRRRPARRPRRHHRYGRKSRSPVIATAGSGQNARIVETVEFADNFPLLAYQNVFSLASFPRAATLAMNFQFYKAAKVTWSYEPLYNTFQEATPAVGTVVSKPYIYTIMNRVQNLRAGATLENIQACGAKPQALISKKSITYKPNWCSPGLMAVQPGSSPIAPINAMLQQGLKCQYGWLASAGTANFINGPNGAGVGEATVSSNQTNQMYITPDPNATVWSQNTSVATNNVLYNGHVTYIDQASPGSSQTPICRLTATVEWHFKGANFNQKITVPTPPTSA